MHPLDSYHRARLRGTFLRRARALGALAVLGLLGLTCPHQEGALELYAPDAPVPEGAATAAVTGWVAGSPGQGYELRVDGVAVPIALDQSYRVDVSLPAGVRFRPVVAELYRKGLLLDRDRVVIAVGDAVTDGAYSPRGLALRINTSGLQRIGPRMAALLDFDLAALLPHKKRISRRCIVDTPFGCAGRARIKIDNPPPRVSGWSVELTPGEGFVDGLITAHDIRIHLQLDGSGVIPDCNFRITARRTEIAGRYLLSTDVENPLGVAVEQLGNVSVNFKRFDFDGTGGICNIIGVEDIVEAALGKLEDTVVEGLEDFLADPDGTGPEPAPIAAAVESAIDDVEISGPIGAGLGVTLSTPLVGVTAESSGLRFALDASAVAGTSEGLASCDAPPGVIDLAASYHEDAPLPDLGPLTPGGLPYDLGLAISTSALNQLFKARTECGLLHEDLTHLDLGLGAVPLTAGLVAEVLPAFGALPPDTRLLFRIRPGHAPLVTRDAAPGAALAELQVSDLRVEVLARGGGRLLDFALDARLGLYLVLQPDGSALGLWPAGFDPESFDVTVLEDALGVDVAALRGLLPELFGAALAGLDAGLSRLPLPRILDLDTRGVEVARMGDALAVFLSWEPLGTTPSEELPEGLAFRAMTFNAGTTLELGHDLGNDPYTRREAEIADALYENSLSWNPAEAALRDFIAAERPDVLAFQELFYDPWCENIPVDPSLDFVCRDYTPGGSHQIERLLGTGYQIACAADLSTSLTDPRGQPDNCVAVHQDFGHFPSCAGALCMDGLRGLPPPDGCTSRPRVAGIEVEVLDGRRFTLVNVHATSGNSDADRACRKAQFRQIFIDRGDGRPEADGLANLILGDINTDPFTATLFDESADAWSDWVGPGLAFDYVSPDGASAPASYLGIFHVDHVVSDAMKGRCVVSGVSNGTTPILETPYWDHSPVVCDVVWPQ